jgi:peptidoglycan/LPS O-acetylase OafA/YrhL
VPLCSRGEWDGGGNATRYDMGMTEQLDSRATRSSTAAAVGSFKYIGQLDGLRAIAVLLVVAHHAWTPEFSRGYVGVDVFFVISGFLITGILLREFESRGTIRFRRFYLRRAVRLYPALLLCAAVVAIPGVILASSGWGHVKATAFAVLYLTPITREIDSASAGVWSHTWSLGIEEMFYLVWPVVLLLALRAKLRPVVIAILATVAGAALLYVFADTDAHFLPSFMRAGGIFIGCALALLVHQYGPPRLPRFTGWIALAVMLWVSLRPVPGLQIGGVVIVVVIATVLAIASFVAVRQSRTLAVVLGNPVMAYIGRISYELYLWHFVLLSLGMWWAGRDATMADVAWWAVPLSFGAAAATHALVTPLMGRLRKRVS